jgi:hypothetical protein
MPFKNSATLFSIFLYPLQLSCRGVYWFHHIRPSVRRQILCRTITWVVFLRMFWNFISSLSVKREGSLSFLTIFTSAVPELLDLIWRKIIFRHIKSNNSGTAKVKIVKNERDPPLFTGKLLIKFQNILRNTTHNFISSLPVKRGGSLSFLMIFTFTVPELLELIWRKIGFLRYVVW